MKIGYEPENKGDYDQIRVKVDHDGTQAIVMVGLDGWNFNQYDNRAGDKWNPEGSTGKQVRISMNSPLRLTWEEWEEFKRYVDAAWQLAIEIG